MSKLLEVLKTRSELFRVEKKMRNYRALGRPPIVIEKGDAFPRPKILLMLRVRQLFLC